jgi:serine/threonine-protein kinase
MSDVLARLTDALHTKYRLDREVGAGGMATVYLAHDLRHERDVAIKVLHPDLAAALGAERFLAEIKTTAKLQHPHILPLLDSGEADGLLYYVMPYVAGESLRARLDRETQLAIDDAIRIAREVASAIESAHKHGVVHRDIKPENILLHEDQALVADFGIALAVSAAGGARMTQTGLSLGTPQYMAPEQAMGERVIDGRADIYALGAVTYEMLVGEAPFTGPSVQAIVARVMTESPRPVTVQRRSVPQNVNAAVLKALEKLPADRFSSAADFSRALVTSDYGVTSQPSAVAVPEPRPPAFTVRSLAPWIVAGIATIAAIAFAYRAFSRPPAATVHLAVDLPPNFKFVPGETETLGISADGSTITFAADVDGKAQMTIRRLDSDSLVAVKGPSNTQGSAEISPDGKWLVFGADRKIWKVPVAGGAPTPLAEAGWAHITWVGNGELVYTRNYDTGLYRISSDGGEPRSLTTPDRKKGELGQWWPQLLPDGDHILFTNYTTPADKSTIEVLSLKTGKRDVVFRGGWYGRYVAGHLLFTRDVAVMVVPFDVKDLKVTGTAIPLPIEIASHASNGWAAFAVSPTGTLVYLEDALKSVEVVWSDENGNEEAAVDSAARITSIAASPDNRKIALVRDGDVWIYDRERGVYTRLTNSEQVEFALVWTPDSREILYSRDVPQYDVFRRVIDASAPEQLVATSPNDKHATAITPDGKSVIFTQDVPAGADVFVGPLDPSDKTPAKLFIGGTGNQGDATFSPDGRWVTFDSFESGRSEVYIAAYPLGRGPVRQQVSPSGGTGPSWSRDGRSVYYVSGDRFWRARFDPQSGVIGKPEMLTKIHPTFDWSIGPDGRFLLGKIASGGQRSLKVILNWTPTLDQISRPTK